MRVAAMPEATVCSLKPTNPLPTPSSTSQPRRSAPPIAKRIASITKGGIVSIATAIPRYVDPHTKYTVSSAAQMVSGEAGDVGLFEWSKVRAVYVREGQAATSDPDAGRQSRQAR